MGVDQGIGDNWWYKDDTGSCRYRFHVVKPEGSKVSSDDLAGYISGYANYWTAFMLNAQRKVIDLDDLDPRTLSFHSNGIVTTIISDSVNLFTAFGDLNEGRLKRGWQLIFSQYCRGKEKPF